jgi:hypothetical protein
LRVQFALGNDDASKLGLLSRPVLQFAAKPSNNTKGSVGGNVKLLHASSDLHSATVHDYLRNLVAHGLGELNERRNDESAACRLCGVCRKQILARIG